MRSKGGSLSDLRTALPVGIGLSIGHWTAMGGDSAKGTRGLSCQVDIEATVHDDDGPHNTAACDGEFTWSLPRRMSGMTIGRSGTVIRCNASACRSHLSVPVALIDQPAKNIRRWAAWEQWTADPAKGLDWCSRHPQLARS